MSLLPPEDNVAGSRWQARGTLRSDRRGTRQPWESLAGAAPFRAVAWDYLCLTAANEEQAAYYRSQLALRREQGMLGDAARHLVVADPDGKRIGSGGSTLECLRQILSMEMGARNDRDDPAAWREVLAGLRILILHAGGDCRRVPAYSCCGKIFAPLPGVAGLFDTLFDLQVPLYFAFPAPNSGAGQIVIASGDVLLGFDPREVVIAPSGVTGLASSSSPEQAAQHGVFSLGPEQTVRRFFQKPSIETQVVAGLVDRHGQTALDVGVMSFDAETAVALLEAAGPVWNAGSARGWRGPVSQALLAHGLDFYREIACALGSETSPEEYIASVQEAGSAWDQTSLRRLYDALRDTPFVAQMLSGCRFLHFGTTRQLISSGRDLAAQQWGAAPAGPWLDMNNDQSPAGSITGANAWVEGCRIRAALVLRGDNVVVGAEIDDDTFLPAGACLDVLPGYNRRGEATWFVRFYGIDDAFKGNAGDTYCGHLLADWLASVGAKAADVWDGNIPAAERTIWNARLFPEGTPSSYARWQWVLHPEVATDKQKAEWLAAPRYSMAEMTTRTDRPAFHLRRTAIRSAIIRRELGRAFSRESCVSAAEVAYLLRHGEDGAGLVADILGEARRHYDSSYARTPLDRLIFSRIIHTIGSAVDLAAGNKERSLGEVWPGLAEALPAEVRGWLADLGLRPTADTPAGAWSQGLRTLAFSHLARSICSVGHGRSERPTAALRSDEIVWGRAPARLDLSGGWTDTPPFSLEFGGCVLNAAVNLNGQPPVQAFARVIAEPVIRLASIDCGTRTELGDWEQLLDFRRVASEFALAKAALALSGLTADAGLTIPDTRLRETLEEFGGGIELTTLAAVPKGSGLGTSSIMGAVLLAVLDRVMGRATEPQQLFHRVLQLEQAMTTGGGWQDQIGGVTDGVKLITTAPGMVPDAVVEYVPGEIIEPAENGGQTLLYYTGITRLAKNILEQVVGRYLDRDRATVTTLGRIGALASRAAGAMARRDLAELGRSVGTAWLLNKRLDPGSSNPAVEELQDRIRPYIHGAKLLGAGGGGFLLIICRSAEAAQELRVDLESNPPNPRARFFQYSLNHEGLRVTAC